MGTKLGKKRWKVKSMPDERLSVDFFKSFFNFIDGYRKCEWEDKEIEKSLILHLDLVIERNLNRKPKNGM